MSILQIFTLFIQLLVCTGWMASAPAAVIFYISYGVPRQGWYSRSYVRKVRFWSFATRLLFLLWFISCIIAVTLLNTVR